MPTHYEGALLDLLQASYFERSVAIDFDAKESLEHAHKESTFLAVGLNMTCV